MNLLAITIGVAVASGQPVSINTSHLTDAHSGYGDNCTLLSGSMLSDRHSIKLTDFSYEISPEMANVIHDAILSSFELQYHL